MKKSPFVMLLSALVLLGTISSCATNLSFLSSPIVPAAIGNVKISKDSNSNYAIRVKVTNLADPSRLQPKRELYVVWSVTKNNGTKNIGQLKSSTGFFSSLLVGELSTVSPFKPKQIIITAEDSATIQSPKGFVVLTTRE